MSKGERLISIRRSCSNSENDELERSDQDVARMIRLREAREAARRAEEGDSSNRSRKKQDLFVPAFVGVWAIGYGAIYYLDTRPGSGGLGDSGGVAAVVLTVALFVGLFVYALIETFKPVE